MVLQIANSSPSGIPSGPIELILSATLSTKIVLIVLACLSLLSWSIMFAVWRSLGSAPTAAAKFTRDFEAASRLEEAGALARRAPPSALPRLLLRALHFVSDARVATQQTRERATMDGSAPP